MKKIGLVQSVFACILVIIILSTGFMLPVKQASAADFITAGYEFNTDGNMEGWVSNGNGLVSADVGGGSLNIETGETINQYWYSPWPINLAADAVDEVVFRMKTDKGSVLRVFFDSDLHPGLGADKLLEIPISADGAYHEYRVNVGSHPLWEGTIVRLRFDLMPDASRSPIDWSEVRHAQISMDYVRFMKTILEEPVERQYEFNTDNELEGWVPNGNGLASVGVSGGSLNIRTGSVMNPYWYSPWPINLQANTVDGIVIRMKTDKGSALRIFFDSDLHPGLAGDKIFDVPVTADGQYHEYRIDVGSHALWGGTIQRLRFDLYPDLNQFPLNWSDVFNSSVSIDYVRFLQSASAIPDELYASPAGSGSECSLAHPCSLVGARNKVRTLNYNMNRDITVYLLDGTYTLASPLQLSSYDSGSNGYEIIYKAAPGAKPVISGGKTISGWTLYDSAKQIYKAEAPAGFDTRQLFVDGKRATRAMNATSPEGWKKVASYGYSSTSSATSSHTEYVIIDLATAQPISSLKLYPRGDIQAVGGGSANFPVDFTIDGSTDGIHYTVLTTVTNQPNPNGAAQEFAFATANVRYLKLTVTKLGVPANDEPDAYRLQLAEIEALYNGNNAALRQEVSVSSSSADNLNWGADKLTDGIASPDVNYVTPDADMANWKNRSDIEAVILRDWQMERCLIDSIDGTNITMKHPCWGSAGTTRNEKPTWIENAYELLDSPGEWYLDKTGAVDGSGLPSFYYKPLAGQNMSSVEVIAPALESAIVGSGTLDHPVHHIDIEGLTFNYTGWTFPNSLYGYPGLQAGLYAVGGSNRKPPAAVSFTAAQSITVKRNIFTHLGGSGLNISNGSQNNLAEGNVFEDISSVAVWIGSNDDHHMYGTNDTRWIMKDNTVRNNYVTNIGVEYADAVAIFDGYTDHTVIAHNEIENVPYTGISVGYGFGLLDPTVAANNVIQSNLLHHTMRVLHDGSAIYTQSAQPNSTIAGNYIHHTNVPGDALGSFNAAIYLDNGTQNFNVHDNVVTDADTWLFLHDNQNNTIQNNYFTDQAHIRNDGGANNNVSGNTVVADGNWPQAALYIMNSAGLESGYQDIKTNRVGAEPTIFTLGFQKQSDSPALAFGLDPEVTFHIQGQSGTTRINKQARSVTIFMPTGTSVAALQPQISLKTGYTVQPGSGIPQDYTNPIIYTVTAPDGAVSLWTVQVSVLDDMLTGPVDTAFVSLDPYLQDTGNWTGSIAGQNGEIMFAAGVISSYKGQKFNDQLLQFYMELPLTGQDWMGFNLRDKYPNTSLFAGNTSYHFVVKKDVWELQKWIGGSQEMLIGQYLTNMPRWGILPNTQFHSNTKHKIQAGAINVPEGVRLVLYVDGERIFDVVDTLDPIRAPGYFTVYPMSGPIKLSKVEEEPDLLSISMSGVDSPLAIGDRRQTVVSAVYSNASNLDVTESATITSSDTQVATVSPSGEVHALNPGTTRIKAEFGGQEQTVELVVEATVATMDHHVNQYAASGELNGAFAAELIYRLSIIQTLLNQGAKANAAAYMQDFLTHINDLSVRQQNLISTAAAAILNVEGTFLIQSWTQ